MRGYSFPNSSSSTSSGLLTPLVLPQNFLPMHSSHPGAPLLKPIATRAVSDEEEEQQVPGILSLSCSAPPHKITSRGDKTYTPPRQYMSDWLSYIETCVHCTVVWLTNRETEKQILHCSLLLKYSWWSCNFKSSTFVNQWHMVHIAVRKAPFKCVVTSTISTFCVTTHIDSSLLEDHSHYSHITCRSKIGKHIVHKKLN